MLLRMTAHWSDILIIRLLFELLLYGSLQCMAPNLIHPHCGTYTSEKQFFHRLALIEEYFFFFFLQRARVFTAARAASVHLSATFWSHACLQWAENRQFLQVWKKRDYILGGVLQQSECPSNTPTIFTCTAQVLIYCRFNVTPLWLCIIGFFYLKDARLTVSDNRMGHGRTRLDGNFFNNLLLHNLRACTHDTAYSMVTVRAAGAASLYTSH